MTEHSRRQHKPNRNKSTKSNDIKEMERFFKIAHIPKINLPDKKDTQDAKVIPSTPFESQEELSTECEGCGENAACKKSRPAGMILCRNCEAIDKRERQAALELDQREGDLLEGGGE